MTKVRYYEDIKKTQFVDVGHILNIGVVKDYRDAIVSVITIALSDGTVITTNDGHIKVIMGD